jgi:hypothetical protein
MYLPNLLSLFAGRATPLFFPFFLLLSKDDRRMMQLLGYTRRQYVLRPFKSEIHDIKG